MPQGQVRPTIFFFGNVLCWVGRMAVVVSWFVSVCVTFLRCVSAVLFVFSYVWVWVHIPIGRVTVFFYIKFMYLVLMLYWLFSSGFVWCLVRCCVCYILMLCRCSPLIFNAFPSVLVCCPNFVFCPWICEFWTAVYYCCLYLYVAPEDCMLSPTWHSILVLLWMLSGWEILKISFYSHAVSFFGSTIFYQIHTHIM